MIFTNNEKYEQGIIAQFLTEARKNNREIENNCKCFMASMLCEIQLLKSGQSDFVPAKTRLWTA